MTIIRTPREVNTLPLNLQSFVVSGISKISAERLRIVCAQILKGLPIAVCLNPSPGEASAEVYCVLSSRKLTMHTLVLQTSVASRANLSNPSFVLWLSSFNTRYWYLRCKRRTTTIGSTILVLAVLRQGGLAVQSVHSTKFRVVRLK